MADNPDRLEEIARSLAKIEAMYGEMLRKQDEERAEAKERQKKFDEESVGFAYQQKAWAERDKALADESRALASTAWMKGLGNLLLMAAVLVLAIVAANKR